MSLRNINRMMSGTNTYKDYTYYIMNRNWTTRILTLSLTHANCLTHLDILWNSAIHSIHTICFTHVKIWWTHTNHAPTLPTSSTPFSRITVKDCYFCLRKQWRLIFANAILCSRLRVDYLSILNLHLRSFILRF